MSWTKRQIVAEAFAELALAGYVFDLSPEELTGALRRLDTMMATWDGLGLHLGYPLAIDPDTADLDQPSGLPLRAVEAVYMGLAVRLAAGKGKQLQPATVIAAKRHYEALLGVAMTPADAQQLRDGMPRGAGARRRGFGPFLPRPDTSPTTIGDGGNLEFPGG